MVANPPLGSQTPRRTGTQPLSNPFTPPIPVPTAEVNNLRACVEALKSSVESLAGQRGDAANRAVTFRDLVSFGVISPAALQSSSGAGNAVGGIIGNYLPLTGGTLSGPLVLAADPIAPLEAVTKQYADSHYLLLTGGTLTGLLTLSGPPTVALHAATKAYVDGHAPLGGPYLPLTGGTLSGYLTSSGVTNNGWFYTGINSPAYPTSFGGLATSWNFNVGQGDVDFWNCYTGGSGYSSFYWYQLTSASAAAISVMQCGPSGLLVSGQVQAYGSFQKRGGGPSYRMSPNTDNTGIGSFWYTDTNNVYLLLTANNDAWGSYNGLRPFNVALNSGSVSMGQGLVVTGGSINLQNGSSGNTFITYNGGNYVQMFNDGNGHIECNTNLWINSNTGNDVYTGGNLRVAHQIYMPLDNWLWMGGYASLLQSSDGNFYIGDGAARPTRLRGTAVSIDSPNIYLNGYTHVQPGTSDNARITVPNGCHARWFYEVVNTRLWSAGCINNGWYYLADETAGQMRLQIDLSGNATISGALTCGALTCGQINGQGNLFMSNNGHYYLIDNTGRQWCMYADNGIFRIYNDSTGDVLTITQAGTASVGIVTTNQVNVNGTAGIVLANTCWIQFKNNGGTLYQCITIAGDNNFYIGNNAMWTMSRSHFMCQSDNGFVLGYPGNAWQGVYSYGYTTQSDLRFKDDIRDLPECTGLLQRLTPKRYKIINGPEEQRDTIHWGFIAQEVGEVIGTGRDFGGHIDHPKGQGIAYNELTAVLWKACQELLARVEQLEAA